MIHKNKLDKAQAYCQSALNGTIENHKLAWMHCRKLVLIISSTIWEHDEQRLEIPQESSHCLSQWQPPNVVEVAELDQVHLKYGGRVLKPKQWLGNLTPHILICSKILANYKHSILQHVTGNYNWIEDNNKFYLLHNFAKMSSRTFINSSENCIHIQTFSHPIHTWPSLRQPSGPCLNYISNELEDSTTDSKSAMNGIK